VEVGVRVAGLPFVSRYQGSDNHSEPQRDRPTIDYWAATQTNLGTAIETLGEHESGTARLEEAVAAYRDALMELTRESAAAGRQFR
jgi:hypothetical protein